MNLSNEIAAIERRVRASGHSMSAFLKMAAVDDAQWSRWKNSNQKPLLETWMKIQTAANRLKPKRMPKVNSRRA